MKYSWEQFQKMAPDAAAVWTDIANSDFPDGFEHPNAYRFSRTETGSWYAETKNKELIGQYLEYFAWIPSKKQWGNPELFSPEEYEEVWGEKDVDYNKVYEPGVSNDNVE